MGTLSATNRRTLLLMPGTYTITQAGGLVLNTSFVDIASVSGNREDTVITSALFLGTPNITQTVLQNAVDINLVGITIKNTQVSGNGHGLLLGVETTGKSSYSNCIFSVVTTGARSLGVGFINNLAQSCEFIDCEAVGSGWGIQATAGDFEFNVDLIRCTLADGAINSVFTDDTGLNVLYTGQMIDCDFTDLLDGLIVLKGATIKGTRISTVHVTDNLFHLEDSLSTIYNCTLLTGGNAIITNANDGKAVAIAHCRTNNTIFEVTSADPANTIVADSYNVTDAAVE